MVSLTVVMPTRRNRNPSSDPRGNLHDNLHRTSMEPPGSISGNVRLHFPGRRNSNYLHVACMATLTEAFMGTSTEASWHLHGNFHGINHENRHGDLPMKAHSAEIQTPIPHFFRNFRTVPMRVPRKFPRGSPGNSHGGRIKASTRIPRGVP